MQPNPAPKRRFLHFLAASVLGLACLGAVSLAADSPPAAPALTVDSTAAAQRLAGAVQIKTISYDDQAADVQAFKQLHNYLSGQFPRVHQTLRRETINGASLLYTWQGKDHSRQPILLMAHQDVVPIAPGTEAAWEHPPFSGAIADGYIWGRGVWDDKGNLMAMMEAVEHLLAQGFQPQQTVYLAFGHDEETGPGAGQHGARAIAELLKNRGVRLASVLDEGLLITHGQLKGLDAPAALIGVAEKGYVTLKLSTAAVPGHSSMPPARTAIGTLSAGLSRLDEQPFPQQLSPIVRDMLETLAPHFSGVNGFALSNLWLFEPLVKRQMAATPGGQAMLHTTQAMTTIQAGNKENVLPERAEATVNFRILPGDRIQEVVAHTHTAVNDPSITVAPTGVAWEASPVSRTDSLSYQRLKQSIQAVFPGTLVAPGLMVGATDSRHFQEIADDIYRFTPIHAEPEDLARFHGTNERLSVSNYGDMIRFYAHLLSAPVHKEDPRIAKGR